MRLRLRALLKGWLFAILTIVVPMVMLGGAALGICIRSGDDLPLLAAFLAAAVMMTILVPVLLAASLLALVLAPFLDGSFSRASLVAALVAQPFVAALVWIWPFFSFHALQIIALPVALAFAWPICRDLRWRRRKGAIAGRRCCGPC